MSEEFSKFWGYLFVFFFVALFLESMVNDSINRRKIYIENKYKISQSQVQYQNQYPKYQYYQNIYYNNWTVTYYTK